LVGLATRGAASFGAKAAANKIGARRSAHRARNTFLHPGVYAFGDRSIPERGHKPQDILRCKTMVEVAEVQRDLCVDAVIRRPISRIC